METLTSIAMPEVPIAQLLSIAFEWNHLPASARFNDFLIGMLGNGIFLISVICMKDSWQVEIPNKDKTELVTAGIYRFSYGNAPLADFAGGTTPCERLWRAVSGVLPPCISVFGQKINTFQEKNHVKTSTGVTL